MDVETKKINVLIAEIKMALQQFIEGDDINVINVSGSELSIKFVDNKEDADRCAETIMETGRNRFANFTVTREYHSGMSRPPSDPKRSSGVIVLSAPRGNDYRGD